VVILDEQLELKQPWAQEITKDDLPNEDLRIVADLISLEVAVKMMCELQGINISIPQKAAANAKIRYIKKHYDGTKKSRYELAKICGVSEGYIYKIARQRNGLK